MPAEGDRVVIRMYRRVLGDCFLVTVWRGGRPSVAMIDCGSLQRVSSGGELLKDLEESVIASVGAEKLQDIESTAESVRQIQADVRRYLADKGDKLDLLVITHDHYDHVAGFLLPDEDGKLLSDHIKIERLWLSWLENTADPQAKALAARFAKAKTAVSMAVSAALAMDPDSKRLEQIQGLQQFIGPVEGHAVAGPSGRPKTTTQAIQALRNKVGAKTRFLEAGETIRLDGGFDLNVHVLGPPREEARLFKDSPKGKGDEREVYLTDLDEAAAVMSAALSELQRLGMQERAIEDLRRRNLKIDEDDVDLLPFSRPHRRPYPAPENGQASARPKGWDKLLAIYENAADEHRTISDDWFDAAEALALKLDSDTNNSSLALAIELPGDRVLLFPGDAQVGNWESWGDQLYPKKPLEDQRQKSIDEILAKVVFYKVGHHASHNATLRARGLQLMTHPNLSAAITVVEAVAQIQGPGRRAPGKGWKMPYGALYEQLEKSAAKRVVRGDGDPASERAAFDAGDAGVTVRHENPETGGRWVELTFPL